MRMTKSFTENDIIRFLYGEASESMHRDIANFLLTDHQLRNKVSELKKITEKLDNFMIKAPGGVVSRIIAYL